MLLSFTVLFILIGCATAEKPAVAVAPRPSDNLEILNIDCEKKGDKLACARYGYLTKDINYTRQACYLGDQNSCFNVQEIENRAPNQNLAIINAHQGQIYGCYVNNSLDVDNGENAKKDKEINLFFQIDDQGRMTGLNVQGKNLSEKFKKCVMDSFTSKKFIGLTHHQSIHFALILPEVTRDKRVKQTGTGIFD